MDPAPDSSAWGGAKWIGGGNDDLVLYAPYLAIFDVKYALTIAPGSTRASFVYGANDSRLMDKNKNIYQVESGKDQSYIKLELDISAVNGTPDGKAKLHVYRAGYKDTDTPSQPLRTLRRRTRGNQQRQQECGTRHRIPQHLRTDCDFDRRQHVLCGRCPTAPAGGRGAAGGGQAASRAAAECRIR